MWTKENSNTANSPTKLPSMSSESSFQPEQNNLKPSILLQDAQIQQEAKDKLSLLLDGDHDSTVSKSPMDVGRTNHYQINIPTTVPPIAQKPYPITLKYQNCWRGNTSIGKYKMHI